MKWIALSPRPFTDDQPDAQVAAQRSLGWRALSFSPRVALVDEAVLVEISASLRLFGDLPTLMRRLLIDDAHPFYRLHPPRWTEGPSSLVALARLRAGQPSLIQESEDLDKLPLTTLAAAREHLDVLECIGCRNWGDVRRMPREGIARRFGQPLLAALDRAHGLEPESYPWLTLPEAFDEKLELPALVEDAPTLMFGMRRLLTQLRAWLGARQAGALVLRLGWHLDARRDVPPEGHLMLRSAEPTRDMAHLARLASEHLQRIELPAPAHSLSLRTIEVVPWSPESASVLVEEQRKGNSLNQFIERVSARLGPQRVLRWSPRADHRPECMQAWVPAQGTQPPASREDGAADALYPSWLLRTPQRLALRGHRPLYRGEPLALRLGPQRLEATGWAGWHGTSDQAPAMRDYFIAESRHAGLLWVYRERLPRPPEQPLDEVTPPQETEQELPAQHWYLHGFFG